MVALGSGVCDSAVDDPSVELLERDGNFCDSLLEKGLSLPVALNNAVVKGLVGEFLEELRKEVVKAPEGADGERNELHAFVVAESLVLPDFTVGSCVVDCPGLGPCDLHGGVGCWV